MRNLVSSSDKILKKQTELVSQEALNNMSSLTPVIVDLIGTMNEHSALGISACQIGIDLCMFVMSVDGNTKICINPAIVTASQLTSEQYEGCLSFPGLRLKIKRPISIAVSYYDINGSLITENLNDLEARVWLHEYDHCNGILFVDRVSKLTLNMAKRKLNKFQKRNK